MFNGFPGCPVDVSRTNDLKLARLGRYSYAFVEHILGIAPNRSNVEVQLGYILKPRLTLLGTGQWMHRYY